jgi:hypothetical protein
MDHGWTPEIMARIGRLRVLETVAEGEIQSSRAIDTADGTKVILHLGGLPLLDVADTLGADVLERGETGGKLYILTPDRPDLENLNQPRGAQPANPPGEFTRMFQLPQVGKQEPPKAAPVAPPPSPQAVPTATAKTGDTAGEFTRMFRAVPAEQPKATAAPMPAAPTPAAPAPAAELPRSKPESDFGFTGMFSAASRISVEADAPKPQPPKEPETAKAPPVFVQPDLPPKEAPVAAPPPASPAPSEFTRMFHAPAAPVVPPVAARTGHQEQPQRARPMDGEFTRMFNAQPPSSAPNAAAQPAYPVPSSPLADAPSVSPSSVRIDEPGMFTRQFQGLPSPPANTPASVPLPAKPATSDSGEFTRFFQDPMPVGREPDWKEIDKQAPPPPSPKPAGDFTRTFGKPNSGAAPPASSAGASDLFSAQKPASAPVAPASGGAGKTGTAAGGDDYAKMFAPKPPDAPPPLKAPAKLAPIAVEAPGKKPPILVLIIIIVALVVIAGAALYYYVVKAK